QLAMLYYPSNGIRRLNKTRLRNMASITFDTHKFVRTLKAAGVPESQAEAISDAFKEAQGEAELATKYDINDLKRDMHDMEQRLIIRLGGLIAVAIGLVAALVKLI
ncbi:MAG: hypothetical protein ACKN9F_04315, partial [Methylomonas sp.]